MRRITPCLWFDGRAEEAMNFYIGIFKNSRAGKVTRWGDAGPGKKGTVLTVEFQLDGEDFIGLNGGPEYSFTPAVSFSVSCANQEEVDYYWTKLLVGGETSQCGWLTDKFGVSWQVVPTVLMEMLQDKDPKKADRVMQAIHKMIKLDIATLRKAYEQG